MKTYTRALTMTPKLHHTITPLLGLLLRIADSFPAVAQETKKPAATAEVKPSAAELEAKFIAALKNATLKGRWCLIKDGQLGPDKDESYTIISVAKLKDDQWQINARIVYGGQSFDAPVPARVHWAGDTPVLLKAPALDDALRVTHWPARADGLRVVPQRNHRALARLRLPANLERRTVKVGEVEREYFIHIPDAVKGKAAPVLFALHGGASNSGLQMDYKVDFTKLADQEGFVVVYPSGLKGWNIGSADAYFVRNFSTDADDLGFFKAMFDTLIEPRIAGPKRIYVTGGSSGGMMTHRLACQFADRIAGAGVIVATLPKSALETWPKPSHPMPMLIMLGTVDPLVKYEGTGQSLSADATVEFWRKQNGCEGEAKKWNLLDRDPNDGTRIHAQRWEGKAPVLFSTMEGHGNGWRMQEGRYDGTGPKTQDTSAPEEFWAFFKTIPAK